jgi:hypothetical protein
LLLPVVRQAALAVRLAVWAAAVVPVVIAHLLSENHPVVVRLPNRN